MKGKRLFWLGSLAIVIGSGIFLGRWMLVGRTTRPAQMKPIVSVLAYDSFTSINGPAALLKQAFEKKCQCEVEWLSGADSGMLLEKLALSKRNLKVDVVIGFDQLTRPQARKASKFRDIGLTVARGSWADPAVERASGDFTPIDWAPLTFIYRQGEIAPPTDWDEILKPKFLKSLSLQDPRTSSLGLQFLLGLFAAVGRLGMDGALQSLRPNVLTISPSWSSAYGIFQRRQAKMAFSYQTSLLYHWNIEKDESYRAAVFKKGHPVQVEFAAIPESCQQCDLAEQFVIFLLTTEAQKIIAAKNFMFPVLNAARPESQLVNLPILSVDQENDFLAEYTHWQDLWAQAWR